MRHLPLDCNDKALFGQKINRSLYMFYCEHEGEFSKMWRDQGERYWLSFCITFHSFLKKEGFLQYNCKLKKDLPSEAVVYVLNVLTEKSINHVHKMIGDTVKVARFKQLWNNILYEEEGRCSLSYTRLFGSPDKGLTVFNVRMALDVYLQAAGALIILLKRWLQAKEISAKEFQWTPPLNWTTYKEEENTLFESHLKSKWGHRLLNLLCIPAKSMSWLVSAPMKWTPHETYVQFGQCLLAYCSEGLFGYRMDSSLPAWSKGYKLCEVAISTPPGFDFFIVGKVSRKLFPLLSLHTLAISEDTVHPMSQFPIALWKNAFGGALLSVIENAYAAWMSDLKSGTSHYDSNDNTKLAKHCKRFTDAVIQNMITMKKAMDMNSSFHDSLQVETKLTSPAVLYQVVLNHTLMLSWMNTMLKKILEFEVVFNPLCFYPLKEKSDGVIQKIYWLLKDGKTMTQCCILICEGLQSTENKRNSSYGCMLCAVADAVPRLAHLMDFLDQDAYKILEVIFEDSWNLEEQITGECNVELQAEDTRRKIDTRVHSTTITMERHFSSNFRSVEFWLHDEKTSFVKDGRKFMVRAFQILQRYLEEEDCFAANRTVQMECIFDHLYEKMSEVMRLSVDAYCKDNDYNCKIGFINNVILMLEKDGLINSGSLETFWSKLYDKKFNPTKDPYTILTGDAKEKLETLETNAFAYAVLRIMVGNTVDKVGNNKNILLELFLTGCRARLAEAGTKMGTLIQETLNITPSPTAWYFRDAQAKIAEHLCGEVNTVRSIDTAIFAVEELSQKLHAKEQRTVCYEVKMEEKGVFDKEIPVSIEPEDVTDWLDSMEGFRQKLLQRIASVYLFLSRNDVHGSNLHFPYQEIVEHHLVEEMAALRKMMELSDKKLENVTRFMKLLTFRINWLNDESWKWMKVWEIPGSSSNLFVATCCGSVQHAQQIMSIFLKIYLVVYMHVVRGFLNTVYSKREHLDIQFMLMPGNVTSRASKELNDISEEIADANVTIHRFLLNENDGSVSWVEVREGLKGHIRRIWVMLDMSPVLLKDEVACLKYPLWLNRDPKLKEIFSAFLDGRRSFVLKKLRFNEFMAATEGADCGTSKSEANVPTNQKILEQAGGHNKINTKCTTCKISSLEKQVKMCGRCLNEKWTHPRWYCSISCQGKDWGLHKVEHREEADKERD